MAVEAAPLALEAHQRLRRSSAGLAAGKVVQLGLGYAFWVACAWLLPVEQVGRSSGAVAGVMLVTQLALLGVGASLILCIAGNEEHLAPFLDVGVALLLVSGTVAGMVLVGVLRAGSPELGPALQDPVATLVVVVGVATGTVAVAFDQVSMALGRGSDVLLRNAAAGVLALLALLPAAAVPDDRAVTVVLLAWSVTNVGPAAMALWQLRRHDGYRCRPRLERGRAGLLLRAGIPNQVLTLTERVPALAIPLVVSGWVSPSLGAVWYPAWMMAWAVYVIPVSVGIAQFAEGVRRPGDLAVTTRASRRWALGLGGAVAMVVFVGADRLLGVLGTSYAEAAPALRILVLGFLPVTVIQAYESACRARRRVPEAIVLGSVLGVVAVVATIVAGAEGGLVAMAVAWVGTHVAAAAWAGRRLRRLLEVAA